MAGRLEDEEYWHASEAKAFSFEDDEVSGFYSFDNHELPKYIPRLIIHFCHIVVWESVVWSIKKWNCKVVAESQRRNGNR